jgi:hypothetical protein
MCGLALLVVGCSATVPNAMTSIWKDPTYAAGPMTSVVVFAGRVNPTDRRALEDAFVSRLKAQGVKATPSYTIFPAELPIRRDARSVLQKLGYDGVLISIMNGTEDRRVLYPGGYSTSFWGGCCGPGWGTGWDPAYVNTDRLVEFDTTLWAGEDNGNIIWSAVNETVNPTSGGQFVSGLTTSVVSELGNAGFLPGKEETAPVSVGERRNIF